MVVEKMIAKRDTKTETEREGKYERLTEGT